MAVHFLLISNQVRDVNFGRDVASANSFSFSICSDPKIIRDLLVDHPQTIILLDADNERVFQDVELTLMEYSRPIRIFAITDKPANEYEHLTRSRVFGHHIFRRYKNPATLLCSKLIGASISPYPFGLLRYFPEKTTSQKIKIVKSGQRRAAVEAIQNTLMKMEVTSRLSALVAQATDEMLMNAIFDAPVQKEGEFFRRALDRKSQFDLRDSESVQMEIAFADAYIGVSVSDDFGSLKSEVVHKFLGLRYRDEKYSVQEDKAGAGLGLHGIIQTGLSMLFVTKPGQRTEVMIFFPKVKNYKEFKSGFRFLSILCD